ncbi:hypothetical protein BL243_22695 [Ralstonia solanacearum]|nr:hypothetical protein BL243_22695 [Ralstonia solanacearum]
MIGPITCQIESKLIQLIALLQLLGPLPQTDLQYSIAFDNRAPHGNQPTANGAFAGRDTPHIEAHMPSSTLYTRRAPRRTRAGTDAAGQLSGRVQLIAALTELAYQPGNVAMVPTDDLRQLRDRKR